MSNPDVGSTVKPKREVKIAASRVVIPEHRPITVMRSRTFSSGTSSPRGFYGTFTYFNLQNLQIEELDDFPDTYNLKELCDLTPAVGDLSEEVLNRWLESNFEDFQHLTAKNQYTTVHCFKGMSNYLSYEIIKPDISFYKPETNLPLFLSEVHSGHSYICDVRKCLISLVFQLL